MKYSIGLKVANDNVQRLKENQRKTYKHTTESMEGWQLNMDLKYEIIIKIKQEEEREKLERKEKK